MNCHFLAGSNVFFSLIGWCMFWNERMYQWNNVQRYFSCRRRIAMYLILSSYRMNHRYLNHINKSTWSNCCAHHNLYQIVDYNILTYHKWVIWLAIRANHFLLSDKIRGGVKRIEVFGEGGCPLNTCKYINNTPYHHQINAFATYTWYIITDNKTQGNILTPATTTFSTVRSRDLGGISVLPIRKEVAWRQNWYDMNSFATEIFHFNHDRSIHHCVIKFQTIEVFQSINFRPYNEQCP